MGRSHTKLVNRQKQRATKPGVRPNRVMLFEKAGLRRPPIGVKPGAVVRIAQPGAAVRIIQPAGKYWEKEAFGRATKPVYSRQPMKTAVDVGRALKLLKSFNPHTGKFGKARPKQKRG